MKAFTPQIVTKPDRKMVTIISSGNPNNSEKYMKALFGSLYGTKMKVYKPLGKVMTLGKLTAEWPDAHLKPKDEWTGHWGVEVPEWVQENDILQKDLDLPVALEVWPGGEYAEILHIGAYTEEEPTIKTLHNFIEKQGIKMADVPGVHEEEYLTKPEAKVVKTIIRYRLK